jgi:tRNA threonylcarbamoyladenosine biosynthesis protein TsaB
VLILGIESATARVGCAMANHNGVIAAAHTTRARKHAEALAPQIDFVRRQAGVELAEVSLVAVDLGPGLYTGLRVGISTAMALAYALRVPMIGVSSLDLVAYPARFSSRLVAVAIDARRGEVFSALYRKVPGGVQRVSEARVVSPDMLASELTATGEECLLVGDGGVRYAEAFEGNPKCEPADPALAYPSADSLVQLAHARALREEFVSPAELRPIYLRKPDAAEAAWSSRSAP